MLTRLAFLALAIVLSAAIFTFAALEFFDLIERAVLGATPVDERPVSAARQDRAGVLRKGEA